MVWLQRDGNSQLTIFVRIAIYIYIYIYNYTNTINEIKVGKENEDVITSHGDGKYGCQPVAPRSAKP